MGRGVGGEDATEITLGLDDHDQPAPEEKDLHIVDAGGAQAALHFGPHAAMVFEVLRDHGGIVLQVARQDVPVHACATTWRDCPRRSIPSSTTSPALR